MTMTTDTTKPRAAEVGWIRRTLPYVLRHRRDLVFVFGAALGGMAVTAAIPLVMRSVVDDAILHDHRDIQPLLGAMLVLGIIRFALSFVRRYGAGRIGIDIVFDMRNEIYEHLHRLDFARHDEFQSGQLVS